MSFLSCFAGYRLDKEEEVFTTLDDLVLHHCTDRGSLPCSLDIPQALKSAHTRADLQSLAILEEGERDCHLISSVFLQLASNTFFSFSSNLQSFSVFVSSSLIICNWIHTAYEHDHQTPCETVCQCWFYIYCHLAKTCSGWSWILNILSFSCATW